MTNEQIIEWLDKLIATKREYYRLCNVNDDCRCLDIMDDKHANQVFIATQHFENVQKALESAGYTTIDVEQWDSESGKKYNIKHIDYNGIDIYAYFLVEED